MGSQNRYDGFSDYAIAIIRRKAQQLGRQLRCDPLDIEQELAIDLHIRLGQYDPTRLPEHVFISQIIDHKAVSILRYERAQTRDGRREERSLDEALPDQQAGEEVAFGDIIDSEVGRAGLSPEELRQLKHDLAIVRKHLPDRQQRLTELLKKESNKSGAARTLGISRDTAHEDLKHIHERFEKAGLREYLNKRPTHPGRTAY